MEPNEVSGGKEKLYQLYLRHQINEIKSRAGPCRSPIAVIKREFQKQFGRTGSGL